MSEYSLSQLSPLTTFMYIYYIYIFLKVCLPVFCLFLDKLRMLCDGCFCCCFQMEEEEEDGGQVTSQIEEDDEIFRGLQLVAIHVEHMASCVLRLDNKWKKVHRGCLSVVGYVCVCISIWQFSWRTHTLTTTKRSLTNDWPS